MLPAAGRLFFGADWRSAAAASSREGIALNFPGLLEYGQPEKSARPGQGRIVLSFSHQT